MELNFRKLTAREIDCRISQITDYGLTLLLYKDARCDMNILDETVGAMNWKRQHTRDNANCIVSIYDPDKKEWVSKEDTGTESYTEAQKGLASDSFKRSCFNWGIGRELYTAPRIFIRKEDCNIREKNGKKVCYDTFEVTKIEYDANGEISKLQICNEQTCKPVFSMGIPHDYRAEPTEEKPKKATAGVQVNPTEVKTCECCGKPITDYTSPKGFKKSGKELEIYSFVHFKKYLCGDCVINESAKINANK